MTQLKSLARRGAVIEIRFFFTYKQLRIFLYYLCLGKKVLCCSLYYYCYHHYHYHYYHHYLFPWKAEYHLWSLDHELSKHSISFPIILLCPVLLPSSLTKWIRHINNPRVRSPSISLMSSSEWVSEWVSEWSLGAFVALHIDRLATHQSQPVEPICRNLLILFLLTLTWTSDAGRRLLSVCVVRNAFVCVLPPRLAFLLCIENVTSLRSKQCEEGKRVRLFFYLLTAWRSWWKEIKGTWKEMHSEVMIVMDVLYTTQCDWVVTTLDVMSLI